jgi:glycosyltransferase involved in cell wall biosynthesis
MNPPAPVTTARLLISLPVRPRSVTPTSSALVRQLVYFPSARHSRRIGQIWFLFVCLAGRVGLKIVYLISGLGVGGAEMDLLKLLSRMDRDRFENTVVSMSDIGPIGERIRRLGVPVHALGAKRNRLPLTSFVDLVRLLKLEQPLILQTWMYHANFVGLWASLFTRVPHTVWNVPCSDAIAHSDYGSRTTRWLARGSSRLSRWPDAVVTNSAAGIRFHESIGYHPRRWSLIPNGFDPEQFKPDPTARESLREELGVASDALLIGMIGRYHPMKDHRTFLRAAAALHRDYPMTHFVLVGRDVDDSNAELNALLGKNGFRSSVHLLGPRTDTARLMASFDIATSSSAYGEGLSNVIPEAMASGVPCVVTDVGDAAVVVEDKALISAPRDPGSLVSAWSRLIDAGPEERARLGSAARRRIERDYSIEKFIQSYEHLYMSVAASSPESAGPAKIATSRVTVERAEEQERAGPSGSGRNG